MAAPTTGAARDERDHVDRFLELLPALLPSLDLEVEGVVERISSLSRRLERSMNETVSEFGLSYGEWKVLSHLACAATPNVSSPGHLAEHLEISSGAMTNRLDRLEKGGLLRRLPDPRDRRGVRVVLTDEGRRVYEEAVGVQAKKEALVASALNNREKKELNALLRRLMLEFERSELARTE